MAYKDKDAERKAVARAMRAYRGRKADDPEYIAKEKDRKAKWYAENKEKKAAAQRAYRARKKAEALEEFLKGNE